jgi:hypothetical protein
VQRKFGEDQQEVPTVCQNISLSEKLVPQRTEGHLPIVLAFLKAALLLHTNRPPRDEEDGNALSGSKVTSVKTKQCQVYFIH